MRSLRRLLAYLVVILIACSASVYAKNAGHEQITIAQPGKERLLMYLPLYVAIDQGLFDKRGIDVDLKFAGDDDKTYAALTDGSATFCVDDLTLVALSQDKGGPGKIIGLMITNMGARGVTNKDDVPYIKVPADLDGLRVGSLPAPSATYTYLSDVKRHYHVDSLTIVPAGSQEQVALLNAGKIDIATDLEPNISIYEDKGYRPVMNLVSWTDPEALVGLIATEGTIEKQPQTVQKTVESLQEAINLIYKDRQVAYRAAGKIYPQLSDDVIQRAVDSLLDRPVYSRALILDNGIWQRTLKTRLDSDKLKKFESLTVTVDNSFAIQAIKDLAKENDPQP